MPEDFTVVAIIAAYNEADIIDEVVGALLDDGIRIYFIDNASEDDTRTRVEAYRDRGVIGIERFDTGGAFAWEALLRRKEALGRELHADWFIHHDADEFRESPWAGVGLREAIRRVDAQGFNAIDFEVLNFRPTTHDRSPRFGIREALRYYEPPEAFDRQQIKCWKRTAAQVDLAGSGGHEAVFHGRRVFPIRFLLRHYPIRGQAHGERKVVTERRKRFVPEELDRGWHVQYDAIEPETQFVRDPAGLTLYDPDAVRLRLLVENRRVDELTAAAVAVQQELARASEDVRARAHEVQQLMTALDASRHEVAAALEERLSQAQRDGEALRSLREEVATLRADVHSLRQEAQGHQRHASHLRAELTAVLASQSWRVTRPLRAAHRLLFRRDPSGSRET
jgi:glycosyltransferase involved in cell wall biosynthesis